ncbi:hypothetical protein AB0D19_41800, partial [Streptomyces sp. NPDC048489]
MPKAGRGRGPGGNARGVPYAAAFRTTRAGRPTRRDIPHVTTCHVTPRALARRPVGETVARPRITLLVAWVGIVGVNAVQAARVSPGLFGRRHREK